MSTQQQICLPQCMLYPLANGYTSLLKYFKNESAGVHDSHFIRVMTIMHSIQICISLLKIILAGDQQYTYDIPGHYTIFCPICGQKKCSQSNQ